MKRFTLCVYFVIAIIIVQSCASEKETMREGCINKNTLRVVIFIAEGSLPEGRINKDRVSKEALMIADNRCQTIISSALSMHNMKFESLDTYVVSWKIGSVEKRADGHVVAVDYTLRDEIASLLQCK